MTPLRGTSYRGGRAILAPGRAGRAKIKKAHKGCSCGVQDLSNEPLPIALPALRDEQLRKLPSLLYDVHLTILDESETLVTTFKLIGNNTFVHYTFSYFPILSPEPLSYNYFQRGSFVKYKTFAF